MMTASCGDYTNWGGVKSGAGSKSKSQAKLQSRT